MSVLSQQAIEGFQLSPQQERLHSLQGDEPGPYRSRAVVSVEGDLDPARLAAALDDLVARHEILRTTLVLPQGMALPMQAIAPAGRAVFTPLAGPSGEAAGDGGASGGAGDGGAGGDAGGDREWTGLFAELERGGGEASGGATLLAGLLAERPGRALLLLSLPAMCADDRSMVNLVRLLAAAYARRVPAGSPDTAAATAAGGAAADEGEPLQYADIAGAFNDLLEDPQAAAARSFWSRHPVGEGGSARLLFEAQPAAAGLVLGRLRCALDPGVLAALGALAARGGCSLPAALLTGWQALLMRLAQRHEIVVGCELAGRGHAGLATALGLCARLLPVPLAGGEGGFAAALGRAEQRLGELAELQDFFTPGMVLPTGAAGAAGAAGATPFLAFAFRCEPEPEPCRGRDLAFRILAREAVFERFALHLAVSHGLGMASLSLLYDAGRFEESDAGCLLRQLQALLAGAAAAPELPLADLPLLSPAERRQLVVELNRTTAALGWDSGLYELFAEQVRRGPDAAAVEGEEGSLTFRELAARAERLAAHLGTLGVGPEVTVALCAERGFGMVTALLAVLAAGGAYLPLDPHQPERRLALMLDDARPRVILAPRRFAGRLAGHGGQLVCLDDWGAAAGPGAGAAAAASPRAALRDQLAYVIYTSGSTGMPKGVMIPHGAIVNRLAWMQREHPLGPADRLLQKTSYTFDASIWEIFLPLLTGACLVLARAEGEKDPAYMAAELAARRCTVVQFVPSVLSLMLEEPGLAQCRNLRRVFCGGEALGAQLRRRCIERLGVEVINLYGPTEVAIDATSWPGTPPSRRGIVPIGAAIANVRVYLLDRDLEPVAMGLPGNLYVGGAGLARGYLGRPDLTAASFVPDPFAEQPGERLYRTGDVAFRRPDGALEYLGRGDHQVKVRGVRIELDEIAAALRDHPQVSGAAVTVREDEPGAPRLVAYLVAPAEVTSAAVRTHLEARLPEAMLPSAFVRLAALPLLPNGKIDRAALPPPEAPRGEAGDYAPPRDAVEELLAGIWEELLGAERIGIHDDFFELGGHSLLATRVVTRLRQALGVEIKALRSLFAMPTVAGFAAVVKAAMRGEEARPAPPLVPVPRGGELPLSFAQQRIWFLGRLTGAAAYNLTSGLRLRGRLATALLARSLAEVVRRHEALRTAFPTVGGQPVQAIAAALDVPLPVVDLAAGGSAAARESAAMRLAAALAGRAFDLARAPLVRLLLLRLGPEEHVLVAVMHHIVGDGWSTGVLLAETAEIYSALAAGRAPSLPELPVQYADYALWQREWLQGEVLAAQLAYWRRQLAGSPAATELPTDRPRPAEQSYRGRRRRLAVSPELTAAVRAAGRARGATLFMALLAALDALLHRYSGQTDLVVGSPIANRGRSEIEGLVGVFINTLVLRVDLAADPSFATLVERCRETAFGAFAHQDLPFERLVEELQPARDLSRSPLFQVMLMVQNTPLPAPRLAGLAAERLQVDDGGAKFDLTLEVTESAGGLAGSIEFAADLFDAATVDRFGGHWLGMLEGLAWSPERQVGRWPLLRPAEAWQLLAEWNDTAGDGGAAVCIHELFQFQAALAPERVALAAPGRTVTYGELAREAASLAAELRALGVGPEDRVGIHLERSAEMVVALLATLSAGAAYVPLDPAYPQQRRRLILEDSGAAAVITQEHLHGELAVAGVPVLCLDGPRPAVAPGGALPRVTPENLAYVIYTSGSTGRPKGVAVTHLTVDAFFRAMDRELGAEPGTWLAVTSISFDISVLELLWTLTRGWRVVLQADAASLVAPAAAERPGARQTIDFSLFYFANDDGGDGDEDRYRLLLEGAKLADRHGLAAVWTPERHFHPFGGLYPNPSVTSAAIAAITHRVQIRAGSVVLPLHHPLRVAEEWSVVDNLSHGRVGISFASGWHADDFVLRPGAYHDRREAMLRDIEVVRRLWRGEALRFPGGTGDGSEVEVRIHPRPVQRELPIWLTAAGNPETFRAAGALGANLLTHLLGQDLEELEEKIAVYRRAWQEAGHEPGGGKVSLMVHTFVGRDPDAVAAQVREPFRRYLRSSAGLLANLARALGQEIHAASFGEQDMEALLDHALERYSANNALFGTVEGCGEMVERMRAVGVDEVACLIDFGVGTDAVLESIGLLAELRRRSRRAAASAATLASQVAEHGVTHLQCTPSLARLLAADQGAALALGSLSALMVGGEALPVDLARELARRTGGPVRNLYGPTETTVWSAVHTFAAAGRTVPIGRPIAGTSIYLADAAGLPVPLGVHGELLIGGAGVTRGYLGRPDLTAERFLPDPFSRRPGSRLYRTGDLGRFTSDGRLEFLGRSDQQIKVRGQRVEPAEIEAAMASYPGIAEVVVAAVPGEHGDPRLTAYYVTPQRQAGAPAAPAEAGRLHQLPNGLRVVAVNDFQARSAYREIFEAGIYLRHGVTLEDGDVVFDVGANSGFFCLFAHQSCRRPRIYAFEPVPETFKTLAANVALHDVDAKLFPYGLSEREETAVLTFYPHMPGLSGRYSEPQRDKQASKALMLAGLRSAAAEGGPELSEAALDELLDLQMEAQRHECRLRSLSDVIDEEGIESIDLLKIDVERAEVDVLRGLREHHVSRIHQVVLEVDTLENLAATTALLRGWHFQVDVDEFAVVEAEDGNPGIHVYMVYGRQASAAGRAAGRVPPPGRSDGAEPSIPELRNYLKQLLPEAMVPSAFVRLPALPRTPNGKVDRRALPAPSAEAEATGAVPPRTALERQLAELWRQVLHVERVGIHDNFFELGGDSILGIQLIARAAQAGLRLTPRQIFQHETIAELAQVVEAAPVAAADQAPQQGEVPLTPIQHWFFAQDLPARHHYNQSVLLVVRRELEPPKLAAALGHLLLHHDALRLRFTRQDGAWRQVHAAPAAAAPAPLHVDLAAVPPARRAAALAAAANAVQESLDLEAGPLVRIALFTGLPREGGERRLLIVIHHLAVDGISWRLLLEDLQTVYAQLERGEAMRLPPKSTAFKRWAEWLADHARKALQAERAYWLAGAAVAVKALPRDLPGGRNLEGTATVVTRSLEAAETRRLLQDVPAAYRSQIDDGLLTALLLAVRAWTGESRLLVDMERHGREEIFEGIDLSRTVGWFSTFTPLLLDMGGAAGGGALLRLVKEKLRRVPGRGIGYGMLRYLAGDAQAAAALRAAPQPEISFNYLGQLDQALAGSSLFSPAEEAAGQVRSADQPRRYLLDCIAEVRGGRMRVHWKYSSAVHRRETIERLADGFNAALRSLLPGQPAGAEAAAAFPLSGLDGPELERLLAERGALADVYPLSPVQQGLLLETLRDPGAGLYINQFSCLLRGSLDLPAFEQAWRQVLGRHAVLRTSFAWHDLPEPLQLVHPEVELPLIHGDWSDVAAAERDARLERYLEDDRRAGYAPEQAPLLRLAVLRLAGDLHQLVFSHHHLLLDGWSEPLIVGEVLGCYESLRGGARLELAPPRPYRDFIAWLRRQDLAAAERYWRSSLAGFKAPNRVSAEPAMAGGEAYGEQETALDEAAAAALAAFARQHHLTLNTVLQGAWLQVLAEQTGDRDLVIGVVSSGRPAALEGVEAMIGNFINTLPLRAAWDPAMQLLPWLRGLQERQAELLQFEYSPLVEVQGWSEVPRGTALFETVLVFENFPSGYPAAPGSRSLEIAELRSFVTETFPFTLIAHPGRRLALRGRHDLRRVPSGTARRLLARVERLLAGLPARQESTLGELAAQGKEEQRRQLEEAGMEAERSQRAALKGARRRDRGSRGGAPESGDSR